MRRVVRKRKRRMGGGREGRSSGSSINSVVRDSLDKGKGKGR